MNLSRIRSLLVAFALSEFGDHGRLFDAMKKLSDIVGAIIRSGICLLVARYVGFLTERATGLDLYVAWAAYAVLCALAASLFFLSSVAFSSWIAEKLFSERRYLKALVGNMVTVMSSSAFLALFFAHSRGMAAITSLLTAGAK